MRRRALQGALVVVVVLAGCSAFSSEQVVRQQKATDALNESRESIQTVESFRFESSFDIEVESGTERLSGGISGRANASTRKVAAISTVRGRSIHTYLDNRTAYRECPPGGSFWGTENLTADRWIDATVLGGGVELFSSGDLYWNGTEQIDGETAVHISGEPRVSELDNSQTGAPETDDDNTDSLRVDMWLDDETYRPLKWEMTAEVSADGETASLTVTTNYRDYGEAVSVDIPDDARDTTFDHAC